MYLGKGPRRGSASSGRHEEFLRARSDHTPMAGTTPSLFCAPPSLALLTDVPVPAGYSLVTHIPAGARDIQIVERRKSADVLGA